MPITPAQSVAATHVAGAPTPDAPKNLWRFAAVGLGPLAALGIFALLVAVFQYLA